MLSNRANLAPAAKLFNTTTPGLGTSVCQLLVKHQLMVAPAKPVPGTNVIGADISEDKVTEDELPTTAHDLWPPQL